MNKIFDDYGNEVVVLTGDDKVLLQVSVLDQILHIEYNKDQVKDLICALRQSLRELEE